MPLTTKGLTLIELLLTMVIASLLVALLVTAYLFGLRLFAAETGRTDVFWDGQRAAEIMAGEIRECLLVTSAEAGRLQCWWRDLDSDGTSESGELVTYDLSGRDLIRTTGSSARKLAGNLSGLSFAYDTNPLPKLITITLSLSAEGRVTTIETRVRARND
jgi:prepilin-type N-terminal cleavage/methylation domain-containing protein